LKIKKCDVNEDRKKGLRKGGVAKCDNTAHLRASIAGTSSGKPLFDVFDVFLIFERLGISYLCRLQSVSARLISEGVFFGAFIFASSGRRQNDEILGLAF
jgi:hypothetical protein